MSLSVVSMAGNYIVEKEWYKKCAKSWSSIKGVEGVKILNDGSLANRHIDKIESIGYEVVDSKLAEEKVTDVLGHLEGLIKLRKKSVMFKKLIDTTLVCNSDKIFYVDSDVYVREKIRIPQNCPDILYSKADVPGYSGSPLTPLLEPIVAGLNGGILLYTPDICDWEFLDEMAERYLLGIGRPWWLEQTCWALLAGRTDSKGVFDGRDVRNISGLKKRTPKEIKSNVTKWVGSSKKYKNDSVVKKLIKGSKIVHFAGPGKRLMKNFALEGDASSKDSTLRWEKVKNANILDKIMLSLRMSYNNRNG